jgi:hypothetical protein
MTNQRKREKVTFRRYLFPYDVNIRKKSHITKNYVRFYYFLTIQRYYSPPLTVAIAALESGTADSVVLAESTI